MVGVSLSWGVEFIDVNYWNNNKSDSDLANAICVFKIPRQYFAILLGDRRNS